MTGTQPITVQANPLFRRGMSIGEFAGESFKERAREVQSMLGAWLRAENKRKEALIRAALLKFILPFELDLMETTKSTAILASYGLKVEQVRRPHLHGPGLTSESPGLFRIYQHGKLALEVDLDEPLTLQES